jgi:hypothetical protein
MRTFTEGAEERELRLDVRERSPSSSMAGAATFAAPVDEVTEGKVGVIAEELICISAVLALVGDARTTLRVPESAR